MPATDPTGSIAMAPKLDTDKLKQAIDADWKITKVQSCSMPSTAMMTCSPVTAMNANSAVCEMRRIPKRSTMRELMNAAIPMKTAHNANILGIRLARWNTSEKICCTMPT